MLINGYSDNQNTFLETILDKMFNFKVDEKRFDILKEQYLRGLKNFSAEQPYQLAIYYLAVILTEQAWTKLELIDAMKLVTVERLNRFIDEVLSRMYAECFIYGNVNKEKAKELYELVENQLNKTNSFVLPQLSRQLLLKREYKLDEQEPYLFETENKFHKSSCSSLYIQCGIQEDKSNVFIDLVTQILSEPCYNQLRTIEQLGYIVSFDNMSMYTLIHLKSLNSCRFLLVPEKQMQHKESDSLYNQLNIPSMLKNVLRSSYSQ